MAVGTTDDLAISLSNVSKSYRYYERPLDRLREIIVRRSLHVNRHSVSDISLTVGRGEVVGIIGRNGAGKSTLLKMIAGRLEPTFGEVTVNGSIAAILELGTGFHPDLSGRENVKVGGLCLGLTKRQIEEEMNNIIAFSELEDVIDMPFRTYSSGMQARLTFATAVTVDPDILIIDEALSVGDNKFQLKSFNRIREFKDAGKTILLVTHGMGSVTSFCDRAILLDKGRVLADGDPRWVTDIYHNLQFGEIDEAALISPTVDKKLLSVDAFDPDIIKTESSMIVSTSVADSDSAENIATPSSDDLESSKDFVLASPDVVSHLESETPQPNGKNAGYRYGDKRASIIGVAIFDRNAKRPVRQLEIGKEYQLVMDCRAEQDIEVLYCGYLIRDIKGDILFGSDTTLGEVEHEEYLTNLKKGDVRRVIARIRVWLGAGDYFLSGAVTAESGKQSDMWFDAFEFKVVGRSIQHTNSRAFLEPQFIIHANTQSSTAQDRPTHD